MPVMSYIQAVTAALREEMLRDKKVFILGEDVGKKGGVFRATGRSFTMSSENTGYWTLPFPNQPLPE